MSSPQPGARTATPRPPHYATMEEFAVKWLLPFMTVRLGEANREGTLTWCPKWWTHSAVGVRVAHLHRAFEAARVGEFGLTLSSYLLDHVDPHMAWIMDGSNGPLHRCKRTQHRILPSLPFEPCPPDKFPVKAARKASTVGGKPVPAVRYRSSVEFVEHWLLPVTSVRITGNNREGTYSWCPRWWDHRPVVNRFVALHRLFETARVSDNRASMSGLFVNHIDKHMRQILDAANGPFFRCTATSHDPGAGLPFTAVPLGWFTIPGVEIPVEELGFGPDFRGMDPSALRP